MSFMNTKGGWHCQFLEEDLKTPLPRKLTFQTAEKVEELIRRGGRSTLSRKQPVEILIGPRLAPNWPHAGITAPPTRHERQPAPPPTSSASLPNVPNS
jgi:hypothetical protein